MTTETEHTLLDLDRDFDAVRALFPVNEHRTYLLNAGQSPLNMRSHVALEQYMRWAATDTDKRPETRAPLRKLLSGLLGGQPNDYAIMTSTGNGISTVAAGMNWQAGDTVVLPAGEHWNSTFPRFNLANQGVEIKTVQPDADNRVTLADMAAQVDERTRVISVTAVRFDTGFRADLRALSEELERGAWAGAGVGLRHAVEVEGLHEAVGDEDDLRMGLPLELHLFADAVHEPGAHGVCIPGVDVGGAALESDRCLHPSLIARRSGEGKCPYQKPSRSWTTLTQSGGAGGGGS